MHRPPNAPFVSGAASDRCGSATQWRRLEENESATARFSAVRAFGAHERSQGGPFRPKDRTMDESGSYREPSNTKGRVFCRPRATKGLTKRAITISRDVTPIERRPELRREMARSARRSKRSATNARENSTSAIRAVAPRRRKAVLMAATSPSFPPPPPAPARRGSTRSTDGRPRPAPRRSRYGHAAEQVRRGDVRAAILVVLADKPMHGYQVMQELGQRSGRSGVRPERRLRPIRRPQQLEDEGLVRRRRAGRSAGVLC